MPNIAQTFKQEISRVARKELRDEMQSSRKAATSARAEIASLKRRMAALEKTMKSLSKHLSEQLSTRANSNGSEIKTFRFSPTRLAAHRKRLALSAADMARLLNTSAASIYKWESGPTRPSKNHMPAIAALRTLSKSQAESVLR